jgi:hypothetical protein
MSLNDIPVDYYQLDVTTSRSSPAVVHVDSSTSWKTIRIRALTIGQTFIYGRLKLGQQQCTDDRTFSQNDLTCPIIVVSNQTSAVNSNLYSSLNSPNEHYVILNHAQQTPSEHRLRTSPFLLVLSIILGACVVLFLAFLLHYFISMHFRRKSTHHPRHRHATHSGAEEANHDWIFLDRNSLEMPMKQPTQTLSSVHNSTLNITSNPLVNTSTLQRQTGLAELSHSQMIAYFDNLKESHA